MTGCLSRNNGRRSGHVGSAASALTSGAKRIRRIRLKRLNALNGILLRIDIAGVGFKPPGAAG
jgi:hypothetical protein